MSYFAFKNNDKKCPRQFEARAGGILTDMLVQGHVGKSRSKLLIGFGLKYSLCRHTCLGVRAKLFRMPDAILGRCQSGPALESGAESAGF